MPLLTRCSAVACQWLAQRHGSSWAAACQDEQPLTQCQPVQAPGCVSSHVSAPNSQLASQHSTACTQADIPSAPPHLLLPLALPLPLPLLLLLAPPPLLLALPLALLAILAPPLLAAPPAPAVLAATAGGA